MKTIRIRVRSVRLTTAGFAVSWQAPGNPDDIRARVLDPDRMPPGHELLTAGAVVVLDLDDDGKILKVRRPLLAWPTR